MKESGQKKMKESGQYMNLWDGAVKEQNFPHSRKSSHVWGCREELQSLRGVYSNRCAEDKAESVHTEGRHQMAVPSPRLLSVLPLGWVGAGC